MTGKMEQKLQQTRKWKYETWEEKIGGSNSWWYFVSKIVLNYCEKKNVLFEKKNVLEKLEEQLIKTL